MSDIATTIASTARIAASAAISGSAGKTIADTSRLATPANLKAAAQKFEAIFVGSMMKSMRSVHLADDVLGSDAQDTFKEMGDENLAQTMAQKMPLGIGTAMEKFLSRNRPDLTDPQPSSATATMNSTKAKVT